MSKKPAWTFDEWLPYPVTTNGLWMPGAQGGIVLTQRARNYYCAVCDILRRKQFPTLQGRLEVEVVVHDPDLKKRDINNLTKSLFDALEMAKVFEDDEQIDETHIYRREVRRGGSVRVRIREIEGAQERKSLRELEKEQAAADRLKDRVQAISRLEKKSWRD